MTEPTPDQALRNLGMKLYHEAARANQAEDDRDTILQIVADHVHRSTIYGGLDIGDLVSDLEHDGYTLPEPTTGEAQ